MQAPLFQSEVSGGSHVAAPKTSHDCCFKCVQTSCSFSGGNGGDTGTSEPYNNEQEYRRRFSYRQHRARKTHRRTKKAVEDPTCNNHKLKQIILDVSSILDIRTMPLAIRKSVKKESERKTITLHHFQEYQQNFAICTFQTRNFFKKILSFMCE